MAIIATVGKKEGFLVQMNGDYNLPFDELEVTGTFESGTILENATTAASSTSSEVLGIVAEAVDGTEAVRVMVRGNPSTVNQQEIVYGDADVEAVNALLEAKGIVVVNS